MKKSLIFLIAGILFWEAARQMRKTRDGFPLLSRREREILNLILEGYTDDEISQRFHVRKLAIERYLSNILKKFNLRDVSSAIGCAIEKGQVSITYA